MVISKSAQIDALMVKSFKRKFREHEISYASVKRHKATMGSLGNPRQASQRDPTSYTLQNVKSGWTDLIAACPVTNQSFVLQCRWWVTLTCLVCTGDRE